MNDKLNFIYQELANHLLNDINDVGWDKLILMSDILVDNASNIRFILLKEEYEIYQQLSFETTFSISDLLMELRDTMLKDTGHRIWGFIFTLYPDGKFEIKYDYNKPEDYD
ncbi:MAG: DUF600 family protein [Acinetobacter sp.]|nr:DUF600 family protein [Acinetobacter sp.]